MTKKYILTVTLNPALDKISSRGRVLISAGGKGINVARALESLGLKTCSMGFLGGTSGKILKNILRKEGLNSDFVSIQGETRINVTMENPRTLVKERFLSLGPKLHKSEIEQFKEKYIQLLSKSYGVVFSGRNALGASPSFYAHLVKLAREANIPTVVDTSGVPLELALKAKPWMIKPNLMEAEEVLGRKLNTKVLLKQALRQFHRLGVEIVLLSLGNKGAVGSNGKEMWLVQAPKIKVKNEVGCGDAMVAGFLFAYLKNDSFYEIMKCAVAAGTSNGLSLTPGAIDQRALGGILKRVQIKEL